MKTMYGVVSGEYSNYGVDCLCPDEKTANELCELWNEGKSRYDLHRVEEFDVYENVDDWKAGRKFMYRVQVIENQNGEQRIDRASGWMPVESIHGNYVGDYPDNGIMAKAASDRGFEQAEKSCYDLIGQHKARKAGIA